MNVDENFKQMMEDYFSIEAERHRSIMAQGSEILAKIMAVSASIDSIKETFDKAMADMAATLPAGHEAVLDTFAAPLDELATKVSTLGSEFQASIKSLPVPGKNA